jgi:hypothetical protein
MKRNLIGVGWVIWVSLSAGCFFGASRTDFDLKGVAGTTLFESEQDWAQTLVDGRYRLFNNVWNKGATSGRYRQKIFLKEENGKSVFGWIWKWRESDTVVSYPEILAGHSPWQGEIIPNSGFPFQVGTKRLVANYDVTVNATGSYNLAFEFWTVSSLPPSKSTITHEVMIWIAGERLGAAGAMVGKATIDGNTYSIFYKKDHGDASGAHTNTWSIISLLADKPILHGPLDVSQIIDYLLKNQFLDPKVYVSSLELGNEVMRGSGTTVVRNYAIACE